ALGGLGEASKSRRDGRCSLHILAGGSPAFDLLSAQLTRGAPSFAHFARAGTTNAWATGFVREGAHPLFLPCLHLTMRVRLPAGDGAHPPRPLPLPPLLGRLWRQRGDGLLLLVLLLLPRIFETGFEFIVVGTHQGESQFNLELNSCPVIKLEDFLSEQQRDVGCWEGHNLVEMHSPILPLQECVRFQIEILNVARIVAITRVFVSPQAAEEVLIVPDVWWNWSQAGKNHRMCLYSSLSRFKIAT